MASITLEESAPGFCTYSGVIDSKHAGYAGAGFVDSANEVGASILWAVSATRGGNYELGVRYTNSSTNARGASLTIAEAGYSTPLAFDITSSWTDWQTELRSVSLQQGNNIIRLSATTADGLANIDSLTLNGAGIAAGVCPQVATTQSVYPTPAAVNVNPDVRLRIQFDNTPSIGTGVVEIYDATTNALVDSVNVSGDSYVIGYPGQSSARTVAMKPAVIIDKAITISPHHNKLAYGKTYRVVIANGVFSGTLNGEVFSGFSASQWQFSTKAIGPGGTTTVTVDDDAPADFSSLQGALNYMMQQVGKEPVGQINLRNGVYPEILFLRDKNNLRIVGESRDNTIIRASNGNTSNPGTRARPLFLVQQSDLLSLENLTLHNNAPRGIEGQAEVIFYDHSGRFIAKNSAFLSEQDTLLLSGYSWFYNSLVAGNVDFIWGTVKVALFENSEIRSLGDSSAPTSDNGGYVMQARVTSASDPGFVFLNSSFTRRAGPAGNSIGNGKTYLARSGNKDTNADPAQYFDSFAFINCKMDAHINAAGYRVESGKTQNPRTGTATYGFREYGTTNLTGTALNLTGRIGGYLLNSNEVNQHYANRSQIFASYNNGGGWNPSP